MEKKAMYTFEIVKEDRAYTFTMPMGSPFGQTYDAVFEVLNELIKMSQEAAKNAERKKDEDEKVEKAS